MVKLVKLVVIKGEQEARHSDRELVVSDFHPSNWWI
jgi:hypothetical protein